MPETGFYFLYRQIVIFEQTPVYFRLNFKSGSNDVLYPAPLHHVLSSIYCRFCHYVVQRLPVGTKAEHATHYKTETRNRLQSAYE